MYDKKKIVYKIGYGGKINLLIITTQGVTQKFIFTYFQIGLTFLPFSFQ